MSCLDAITGGKILVSGHPTYRKKVRKYWLKNEKLFLKHDVPHNTEKTEACHGNAPQIFFVARTTTPKSLKEAGHVFLLHKLVFIVSRVD